MSCDCPKQAVYCLQLAFIPPEMFPHIVCSAHSANDTSTSGDSVVTCHLQPDTAISDSEQLDAWPVAYHGSTVNVIRSILVHGQLLMVGDEMHDGTVIQKRCAEVGWKPAIFTNPDRPGAERVAEPAVYDGGQTEFKVLLRLRHRPNSYKVLKGEGFGGYDLWSTDRRGTLYVEALDVIIAKVKDSEEPPEPIKVWPKLFVTTFTCPVQNEAFEIVKCLKLPVGLFEGKYNRCYCATCYPSTWANSMIVANETYAIPRGWTRFGLSVNPVFAYINDIWKSWQIAFHGCHPRNIASIVKNRTLLLPNDLLSNGDPVRPNFDSHVDKCYFLSPEVGYASHAWYAKPVPFKSSNGTKKFFQSILVFKVRPDTYKKQRETEGGSTKLYDDYTIIKEDEVEWFSSRRGCTTPYGLLIRTIEARNTKELEKFFRLPDGYVLTEDSPLF